MVGEKTHLSYVANVFAGGKVEGSFQFLAWIVTGIQKAEQVIGNGKELIFGYVDFEVPARYLWERAESCKYRLRNRWSSGDPDTGFLRKMRSSVRLKLAKSNSCPVIACHD